ncbi:MAG: hypothetical protein IPG84_13745 [Betaproteobacteria bacterium]|nr:hypothetical protein [Betaproteobacteria bacterium]
MSFSLPAAAWIAVNVPATPPSKRRSAETVSITSRSGTTEIASAHTLATRRFTANDARCCAWQPIALITSASPLRRGSSTQRRRLFCGASSMRGASPLCTYSTCT